MASITITDFAATYTPAWAGDYTGREHNLPGGARVLASAFNAPDAVVVVVGAAGAAQAATSVPVDALSGAIPNGTVLSFGTNKFARLTAAAAAGATSLTVAALPTALVDDDTATYAGLLGKRIDAGTLLGRTRTERDAGTGFGPWASGDEEVYLLQFPVTDAAQNPDCELYRHGALVKENLLPGWDDRPAGEKTAIRAAYECVRGAF
jgi:hypothetical protein